MRNLKRALSLALASIMLLGMMVTGAGAASNSFTDFDQIVNQEAAEVTSGLGIFDGYTDGSFGPEKVVTRAEMAVIICKLLNGSDVDPGNFTGISKFTDVPAWAEGYVNYCAASGIVVGVGEGKFNPSATVTTVEAATMLLKALGYFTEEDKLKEDWKTVVTGRATGMKLYGSLTLAVDEGLTRDNVAELVFNTLFAQRVAYDDNRQLYVKNTNRDVVVTNGTQDYLNTFAENTFHMWVVDGLVTANSFTNDDLSETTNNAPRTNVVFDEAAAQDYPATAYQGSTGSEYPFEYTTGLDMIGHAARVYYKMERNAPVVFAIADRATKVAYITYNSNNAALAEAANAAGFRRNTINQINEDDYKVNYAWDVTYRSLFGTAKAVDLTGDKTIDPAKTLLVISNSSDSKVDYVIVLDQYLDTVKRVVTRNDVTEYDLTTVDGVDQNILHGQAAQGDYVVVTDIGKSGDMLNFEPAEKLSANITKITGKSDSTATVKSIVADGTTYVGSPVYDYRVGNSALDDTTDFEDIATIGEATLLLDFQGKCIGLAQPESTPNYAYAAQFGVWHTGGSLNTEFKLTVKLYFLDGTSGVYLVNTDDSQNSNTFYKLKMGTTESAAESVRDRLNGGSGTGAGYVDPTKTYDTNICVDNGTLWLRGKNVIETSDTNGLGIYKVSVRADDTVVMTKLGSNGDGAGHDSSIIPATDETKLISGHSTFVKQNGSNLTYKNTDKVMYQNNKTVYFYVDGSYNTELSVGAKYGVSNAISITNNKDKDDNTRKESFEQILLKGDARTNGLAVEAVLIYGYDMGSSETLYFYRQNDYDIQSKDTSSRAGERNYTITYHLYTADGEPYEATFDNNGKYYDMETAKNTVENKPTGFYAIGSTDLDGKWTSNDPDTVLYKKNGENKDKPGAEGATNVYVLNAEAYHDTYADNLYTLSEVVGGIIPSNAKVVSTVDGCDFDSVSEIARACDNGHLVRISYTYSTSDYKVKTVFITDFKRDAGNLGGDRNPGASLWSSYDASMDRILVFDDVTKNPRSTLAEQLSSAEKALTDAGFTIVDSRTAGMYNREDNTYSWTIEATRVVGNTTRRYFFTGDPAGGQIYGNWYTGAIYTTKVLVNGNLAGYYVPNNTNPAKITVRTVNANKTYDVKWNNSAVVDSVTADEKAVISYLLPTANTGYTVNFVMNTNPVKPIEGLEGAVAEALTGVSATFDGKNVGDKFSAKVGDKIPVVIKGAEAPAPESRVAGDPAKTFVVGKFYDVTINDQKFEGVECKVANQLTVEYVIAEADKTGLKITVKAIVEAEAPVTPTEGTVTVKVVGAGDAGTYTANTTTLTEAGKEYTITITDSTYKTGDTYVVAGEDVAGVDNKDGTITVTYTTPAEIPAEGMTLTVTVTKTAYVDLGDSEIVKATMGTPTGANVAVTEFLAYWADGETAPDILNSKKLIAKALTDAGYSVTETDIDLENKTVTENSAGKGYVISWSGIANGTAPTRLYKVTFDGKADTAAYGKSGASVPLKNVPSSVKFMLAEDKAYGAEADAVKPTAGAFNVTIASADANYVEAIKLKTSVTNGLVTNNLVLATVKPVGTGIEGFLDSNNSKYLQKGATVSLIEGSALKANQKFTLTVNGTATQETAAANGTYSKDIVVAAGTDGEFDIVATASYSVYLDDAATPLTFNANGTIILDGMAGKKLVYLDTTDNSLKSAAGWVAGATGKDGTLTLATLAAASNAVSATGDIRIYRAYELDMTSVTDYKVYTGFPCTSENELILDSNKAYVKAAGTNELYVMAKAANTWLVADDAAKVVLGAAKQTPNEIRKGVWPITLTAALNGNTEIVAGVAFKDVELDLGATGLAANDTNKVAVVDFGAEDDVTIDATKLVWTDGDDIGGGKVSVSVDGTDGTKIVLDNTSGSAVNQAAAKQVLGTLKVVLSDGRSMEFKVVIAGTGR